MGKLNDRFSVSTGGQERLRKVRRSVRHRLAMLMALLAVLACLGFAQIILAFSQWFNWDLARLEPLRRLSCVLPFLCNYGFPRHFLLAIASLAFAALLFLPIAAKRDLEPLVEPQVVSSVGRVTAPTRLMAGILGVGIGLIVAMLWPLVHGEIPDVIPWVSAIIALTAALSLWQCGPAGKPFLAKPGWLFVIGYLALILFGASLGARAIPLTVFFGLLGASATAWSLRATPAKPSSEAVWGRQEKCLLLGIGVISFGLGAYRLNSYRFSVIGDEWSFYLTAARLAKGALVLNPLSGLGNYHMHPAFSSHLQAAAMRLWGDNNYGWRVSNPILVSFSVMSLYVLVRCFSKARVALLAASFYAVSHYLVAFGKVGYNNPQALWPLLTMLAIAMLAIRRQNLLGFWLAGIVAGTSFYVFALAQLGLVLLVLLMLAYVPPWRGCNWRYWVTLAAGALLVGVPILVEPRPANTLLKQTILFGPAAGDRAGLWRQFGLNTVRALTSFLSSIKHTHFVYGAHLDPLTSSAMVLGLVVLLVRIPRLKAAGFLLATYVGGAVLLGGLSQYDYPPNTRMFMLVPLYAIIAAVGLDALGTAVELMTMAPSARWLVIMVGVTVAFLLNAKLAFQMYEQRRALTQECLLVGILQDMQTGRRPPIPVYIIRPEGDRYELARYLLSAYGLDNVRVGVTFLEGVVQLLGSGRCPQGGDDLLLLLPSNVDGRENLVASAREMCPACELSEIRDRSGAYHFQQVLVPGCPPGNLGLVLDAWEP